MHSCMTLSCTIVKRADPMPVGRHLKDVFKKRQQPAYRDRDPERLVLVFQMPVPGERHEHVRDQQ